jgi:hypothetical protein
MFPGDRADRDRETPMAPGFLFGAGRADSSRDADFPFVIRSSFLEDRFWTAKWCR